MFIVFAGWPGQRNQKGVGKTGQPGELDKESVG